MTQNLEPSIAQIHKSYSSKSNTALARSIHGLLSHCTYSRFDAHRWALKLIAANPANGLETAKSLVNFDWMVEAAIRQYETAPRYRRQHDAVFAAYAAWKAQEQKLAA